jgi:hypothetical protein
LSKYSEYKVAHKGFLEGISRKIGGVYPMSASSGAMIMVNPEYEKDETDVT